jgi:hypothetical protein
MESSKEPVAGQAKSAIALHIHKEYGIKGQENEDVLAGCFPVSSKSKSFALPAREKWDNKRGRIVVLFHVMNHPKIESK